MASIRTKIAVKKFAENGGKSLSGAMKEAGFSKEYSDNPQKFKKTKAFRETFAEVFTDAFLTKKHEDLINAKRVVQQHFHYRIKDKDIKKLIESQGFTFIATKRFMTTALVYYSAPNTDAQDRALDKAYKIKGAYSAEKFKLTDDNSELTDEEIADELARVRAELAKEQDSPKKAKSA